MAGDAILFTPTGQPILPKNDSQQRLVTAARTHDVTIALGPAGTGKTFVSVALAVEALRARRARRIVLTRPAVEAGEHLGFLPGTVEEKLDPYMRPLFDALSGMIEPDKLRTYLDQRIIEIAPLAYLRGRTLSDAFVVFDEAQNATDAQIRMLLTRLGLASRLIVSGDPSQTDLRPAAASGLARAAETLSSVDGIAVVTLAARDVVRHALVSRILEAFEAASSKSLHDAGALPTDAPPARAVS